MKLLILIQKKSCLKFLKNLVKMLSWKMSRLKENSYDSPLLVFLPGMVLQLLKYLTMFLNV